MALYYQTTHQRLHSPLFRRLLFLPASLFLYKISTFYANSLFMSPMQQAQSLNTKRELRHQYLLAFHKKGKDIQRETDKWMEETVRRDIKQIAP